MRIILDLVNTQDQHDISLEYHKIQGFIYSLMKESYPGIHDKKGYKPFSYSNIFPYTNRHEGEIQKLIIATPGKQLGDSLLDALYAIKESKIHIGDCEYLISGINPITVHLKPENITLITNTPIIIRIPEKNYDRYNIPEAERRNRYIYWRPTISFDAFVKQLTENLTKKYNDFYGTEVECTPLFERYYFQKIVHSRMIFQGKSYGFVASTWKFQWGQINAMQRKILDFAIDSGFGERNSMGFGFVSPEL